MDAIIRELNKKTELSECCVLSHKRTVSYPSESQWSTADGRDSLVCWSSETVALKYPDIGGIHFKSCRVPHRPVFLCEQKWSSVLQFEKQVSCGLAWSLKSEYFYMPLFMVRFRLRASTYTMGDHWAINYFTDEGVLFVIELSGTPVLPEHSHWQIARLPDFKRTLALLMIPSIIVCKWPFHKGRCFNSSTLPLLFVCLISLCQTAVVIKTQDKVLKQSPCVHAGH